MIWWLAFEKKPFKFWREIQIQVVVTLLQLYTRHIYPTSSKIIKQALKIHIFFKIQNKLRIFENLKSIYVHNIPSFFFYLVYETHEKT